MSRCSKLCVWCIEKLDGRSQHQKQSHSPFLSWAWRGNPGFKSFISLRRESLAGLTPTSLLFSNLKATVCLRMANSKSSQTTRNIVIACLALWSIISLIIIVVWATSPDMKGASQCRKEMQALTEKHEGAKVAWTKDRNSLEELVRQGWRNQTTLQKQIDQYKEQIHILNVNLNDTQQENVSSSSWFVCFKNCLF